MPKHHSRKRKHAKRYYCAEVITHSDTPNREDEASVLAKDRVLIGAERERVKQLQAKMDKDLAAWKRNEETLDEAIRVADARKRLTSNFQKLDGELRTLGSIWDIFNREGRRK